ncbi:hypothetical protein SAMN05216223_105483 [Actinacidiphila yanglinensis]|uniref:Uncharacterized protein n=1 Tax=Actinacidiphila yanglinensis TaxID=310779 RepID=A0A1H6AKY6_9ACTN|nr:hypothetical protein [Actinacidiphila yanglinensis]SEG49403.1 hypothetical protein SAMN05216223_105483 [Actinacidiphila yanglinensis]
MSAADPRSTTSRSLRASVGLTVLAAVLLTCGAAVEATGNLRGSAADGSGSGSPPATTVRPTHTSPHPGAHPTPHSRAPEVPSPPTPTVRTSPPSPTTLADVPRNPLRWR